jgi:N utilization substance protein A
LSPAQVESVNINEEDKVAVVVVPDRQLSLAIGREGQNARLAAKLTGWRIDIKSTSIAEAEKTAIEREGKAAAGKEAPEEAVIKTEEKPSTKKKGRAKKIEEPKAVDETEKPEAAPVAKKEESADIITLQGETKPPEPEEPEIEYEEEPEEEAPVSHIESQKPVIRFAEDILPRRGPKTEKRGKGKKGKKLQVKEDVVKAAPKPKPRRATDIPIYDDDFHLDLNAKSEEEQKEAEAADNNAVTLEDDIFVESAGKAQKKSKKQGKGKTKDKK